MLIWLAAIKKRSASSNVVVQVVRCIQTVKVSRIQDT